MISFMLALSLISFHLFASTEKVIYGEDNRVDVFETTNPEFAKYASATLARVHKKDVKGWALSKTWELSTMSLEDAGVCKAERFSSQPTVASCTGFLVSPKHIVTAGHCMSAKECNSGSFYWLFDYHMPSEGEFNPKRPREQFVSCKRVVKQVLDDATGMDYSLIELTKEVTDREPLKFRQTGTPSVGDHLVVIGHPTGLPTKIADGAQVRVVNNVFFEANLDTFGGNSGSPVINTLSGEVEGILVRGDTDYVQDTENKCMKVNVLSDEEGTEASTLITNIKELRSLN